MNNHSPPPPCPLPLWLCHNTWHMTKKHVVGAHTACVWSVCVGEYGGISLYINAFIYKCRTTFIVRHVVYRILGMAWCIHRGLWCFLGRCLVGVVYTFACFCVLLHTFWYFCVFLYIKPQRKQKKNNAYALYAEQCIPFYTSIYPPMSFSMYMVLQVRRGFPTFVHNVPYIPNKNARKSAGLCEVLMYILCYVAHWSGAPLV